MNKSLTELVQALEIVVFTLTTVGSRLNAMDTARESTCNFILQSKGALSKIEDLDFATAITEFESRKIALEAAQRTFLTIRDLNLFNFIR